VTVSSVANVAPVANFSFTTSGLTASFTDASTDSDGSIASRSWNFGDGGTSTATNPSRTYAAAGTYTVQLTVTDNGGASNSTTRSVTVTAPPSNQLARSVPVTGLSGAASSTVFYTVAVPTGATNLSIAISGGTGDADLYVRFGSQPTTSLYDCRPYLGGNGETCSFAAPQVGTYHVMLRGYSAYSGVSLVANWTENSPGSFFQNTTDFAIGDNTTIESPIVVSGRSGNAPSNLQVAVRILHTYKGDLKVDLIAPDNSVYVLHNRTGGGTDNIIQTFTVNASSEVANGTWKLRVNDNANGDTGTLDQWSLQF
jgi:PKD repeat protein